MLPTITKQQVECWEDAVWKPIPLHGGHVMPTCIRKLTIQDLLVQYHFSFSAINCTQPPFPVKNNDLGMYNWTAVDGVDPRPYASAIKYYCPRENWAYPSTGLNEVMVYCLRDGTWSNQFNIETCQSKGSSIRDIYFKPCPKRYSKPYTNMNTLQKSAKPNTN